MTKIKTSMVILHLASGMTLPASRIRKTSNPNFETDIVDATTTPVDVDLGAVITPMQIAVKMISGDDLLLSFDGSSWPLRLSGAGDSTLLRLNAEDYLETTTITTVDDTGGDLDGLYFDMEDSYGTVRVYFVVTTGTPPSTPGGGRLLAVTFAEDSPEVDVSAAIAAALEADGAFSAVAVGAVVTVTDRNSGVRTTTDAGTSTMAVTTVQAGAVMPVLSIKSKGTSQVVVAVAPV